MEIDAAAMGVRATSPNPEATLATKAAALPATLGGASLVEANALSQLGGAMFQLAGAGAGFIATKFTSVEPVVVVGALVYAGGALSALAVARPGEARAVGSFAAEAKLVVANIASGLREVARTPKAAASISTYFWLRLLWSFCLVGIGFVARALLSQDLAVLILTGGAGALGAVLGYLGAARMHARAPSAGHVVLGASGATGLVVALLGGLRAQAALGVLTFCLGFGFFLAKISLDGMVQEALGDDFRGRAFSLYDIAYNLAWVLAAGIMKLLWDEDLAGALLAGMGIVFLAGVGGLALWFQSAGLLDVEPAPARGR